MYVGRPGCRNYNNYHCLGGTIRDFISEVVGDSDTSEASGAFRNLKKKKII